MTDTQDAGAAKSKRPDNFLISQYEQCWYDVRDHRTRFWQLLLSSALINGALLAVDLQSSISSISEAAKEAIICATLIAMAITSLVLVVQAYKERFFEIVRSKYAIHIQSMFDNAVDIKFQSKDIIKQLKSGTPIDWDPVGFFQHKWVFENSAWNWLRFSLIALPIATGLAAVGLLVLA